MSDVSDRAEQTEQPSQMPEQEEEEQNIERDEAEEAIEEKEEDNGEESEEKKEEEETDEEENEEKRQQQQQKQQNQQEQEQQQKQQKQPEQKQQQQEQLEQKQQQPEQPEQKQQQQQQQQQSPLLPPPQQPDQLPPLRSYLQLKRSCSHGNAAGSAKAPLAPNRVRLDAGQLLPKGLRHSQPGIGYYGRVRERATALGSRAETQWVQRPSLLLGPTAELTNHYYTPQPEQDLPLVANPKCGRYPFSRIIYPSLIGQASQPMRGGGGGGGGGSSSRLQASSQGAFVLRHKLRQSSGCLARILDSRSTSEAVLKRAMSQAN